MGYIYTSRASRVAHSQRKLGPRRSLINGEPTFILFFPGKNVSERSYVHCTPGRDSARFARDSGRSPGQRFASSMDGVGNESIGNATSRSTVTRRAVVCDTGSVRSRATLSSRHRKCQLMTEIGRARVEIKIRPRRRRYPHVPPYPPNTRARNSWKVYDRCRKYQCNPLENCVWIIQWLRNWSRTERDRKRARAFPGII